MHQAKFNRGNQETLPAVSSYNEQNNLPILAAVGRIYGSWLAL
jgi:hypothetical protein